MRLILQCVDTAQVNCYADEHYQHLNSSKEIKNWLLIYVGISKEDQLREDRKAMISKFCKKLPTLKLLENQEGKIVATLADNQAEIMVISNFTLYWHYKSGTKIDFSQSGSYNFAKQAYDYLLKELEAQELKIVSGEFGASMQIESRNSWPINYCFDL